MPLPGALADAALGVAAFSWAACSVTFTCLRAAHEVFVQLRLVACGMRLPAAAYGCLRLPAACDVHAIACRA